MLDFDALNQFNMIHVCQTCSTECDAYFKLDICVVYAYILHKESYILIHLVCQSVTGGLGMDWARARAGTGHGLGTDWAWARARARADWPRACAWAWDWARARAGWARADCVRTSRVPISLH